MKYFYSNSATTLLTLFCLFYLPKVAFGQVELRSTGKVVVKYAKPLQEAEKATLRSLAHGKVRLSGQNKSLEVWEVTPIQSMSKEEVFRDLQAYASSRPEILYIEPDYIFETETNPNDPYFDKQWSLSNTGQTGGTPGADIRVLNQWDIDTGSDDIVAGIIDTGIDWGHEDLVENIWQNLAEDYDGDGHTIEWVNGTWVLDPGDLNGVDDDGNGYEDDLIGWDFVNNDNNPFDDNGHGTHVAGIIGAKGNNGIGIAGVSWSTRMMALKAFDDKGAGSVLSVVPALEYARLMGADLTNNSWGGPAYSQALYDEMELADIEEMPCIAAAGNNGGNNSSVPMFPGSFDLENIICVAATNDEDSLADFSNYSFHLVDVAAPGKEIYSTLPGNSYGYKSGTSMATPMVTGAICLILSIDDDRSSSQVQEILYSTVDPIAALAGKCMTGGRINLMKAAAKTHILCDNFSVNADNRKVLSILTQGEIAWLGSNYGLYETHMFNCQDTIWDDNNGLSNKNIRCLAKDSQGNIWAGTDDGLCKYDGSSWLVYDKDNSDIPGNKIDHIFVDHGDSLWVAINEEGVAKFDGTNWVPYDSLFPGVPEVHVYSVTRDSTDALWIAHNHGVSRLSLTDTVWYNENNSGLPEDSKVLCMAVDSLNRMWFGTYSEGMVRFDGVNWVVYGEEDDNNPGLVDGKVTSLTIDPYGFVWAGTPYGLNKFDGSSFILYDDSDPLAGLPHKNIFSLHSDADSNVWVGTYKGVFVFGNNALLASFSSENSSCLNNPTDFQNKSIGGFTYEWLVDGGSVSTSTHLTHTFTTPGTFLVSLVANNLYDSDTLTKEISVFAIPGIDLGPDTSACAASIVLDAEVTGVEYAWENMINSLLGTQRTFHADSTGMYILEVSNSCGTSSRDTISVTLSGDCVWPGDVNTDGLVDMLDFISLGIANGATGSPRIGATSQWQSEVATDWPQTFDANHSFGANVNYKHADCNGDGAVDILTDGALVMQNAGFSHESFEVPGPEGITLHVEPTLTTLIASDTFAIYYDVSLRSANSDSVEGVYGFAFNVDYDLPLSQAPQMEIDNDLSSEVSGAIITYDENNAATGSMVNASRRRMSFGMVSETGKNRTVRGNVARIGFIIVIEDVQDDQNVRDFTSFSVTPGNLVVIDSLGQAKAVLNNTSSATSTVMIYLPEPSPFPIEWLDFTAEPVDGRVELSWLTANESGREKYTVQRSPDGNMFENLVEIDSKNKGSGTIDYEFVDVTAVVPVNYYRIRRIEEDGSMAFSEILKVRVKLNPFDVTVFPNPSPGPANMRIISATSGQATMRLVGLHGNTLVAKEIPIKKGGQDIPLAFEGLSKGIYYLEVFNEDFRQVVKFTCVP